MRHFLLAAALALAAAAPALAQGPQVVVSIRPVHALVAGVMQDVATPRLLVAGGDSPHSYAMRPSDASAIAEADIVFWIGPPLERFLERPLDNLAGDVRQIALIDVPGLALRNYREDADPAEAHGTDHAADDHDHDHLGLDPHVWLDPRNAAAMVAAIADALTEADPANAPTYRSNAAAMTERLHALERAAADRLAPFRDRTIFTFHDAFGYFAARFSLAGLNAIALSVERQPGARRLAEIRTRLAEATGACVLAEPQFPPRLVAVVIEGTDAATGTVDPIGSGLSPGPDLYFDLIRGNAEAIATCLNEAG